MCYIHSDVYHSPDINECADASVSMCGSNAMCINTNGSFACECPPGFEGDTCSGEQSTAVSTYVSLCLISCSLQILMSAPGAHTNVISTLTVQIQMVHLYVFVTLDSQEMVSNAVRDSMY